MKRIKPLLLAAALSGAALLCSPAPAQATTAPALTLAQQAKKAEVIVRATLGVSSTLTEGGVPYVVYPLTIVETIAGDATSLPQFEGQPALYFMQGLSDLPALGTGQEVIALLYARRLDSPLVGFNQGLYQIVNGQVVPPVGMAPLLTTPTLPPVATTPANPAAPTPTGTATANPAAPPPDSPPPVTVPTSTAPTSTAPSGATPSGTTPTGTPAPSAPAPVSSLTTPAGAVAPGTPAPSFDPSWVDPAKFRAAILAARESK